MDFEEFPDGAYYIPYQGDFSKSNIAQVTGGTGEYTLSGNSYASIDSDGYISFCIPEHTAEADCDFSPIIITDSNGDSVTLTLSYTAIYG